jgi:serine phosphatase RsbU (regulator of sigma subunit)
MADYTYDSPIIISLLPGDFLVLITDGFMEWADSQKKQFGISRLNKALSQHSNLSSAHIIECLRADVLAFAKGTNQKDDLTAVVIKRVFRN